MAERGRRGGGEFDYKELINSTIPHTPPKPGVVRERQVGPPSDFPEDDAFRYKPGSPSGRRDSVNNDQ